MQLSRRDFLHLGGGAGAATALGGLAGLGASLAPARARAQELRIKSATAVPSICPFCSVGCATLVHVKDSRIVNIEGDPRSPHNEGTLCPKGAATLYPRNLEETDCFVIMGSNMAECHPVAFRWPVKAKLKGAKLIHVDPRFTRTSALADIHVPLRAGSDIAFLGGLIHLVLESERWNGDPFFREYVANYTNAATLIGEEF